MVRKGGRDMSIHYDRAKKTYTVRWREKNRATGQEIHKAKRGFTTKKEARKYEEEMEAIQDYASFDQLKDLYIESLIGYTNEETRHAKKRLFEKYAAPLFPMNVRQIKKSDLLLWRNGIAELDRSIDLKNKILQIVKAVSKFGAEYYDYPDFAKNIKAFPKNSDDINEIAVLSKENFEKMLENCSNEVYKRFYSFLYYTGCRRGEALALTKADIKGKTASLNKSIRRYKDGFRPLKNRYSKRSIILSDKAYDSIEPLLDTEGDFIFGGTEPLPTTSISRNFDAALKKAGLDHYRIHDLRHSFISNAILNGVDIVSISRYVGHANIEMTLNRYSHLLKDSEQRMINRLNELNSIEVPVEKP